MEDKFEKAEEFLNKQPLLKLKGVDQIESDSTKNLVCQVLKLSRSRITILSTDPLTDPLTMQCSMGRRRSIGDIYNICRFYKPDVSLKDIQESLLSLLLTQKIWTLICPDIHKRVWRYEPEEYNSMFQGVPTDEYWLTYDIDPLKTSGNVSLSMLDDYEKNLRFLI